MSVYLVERNLPGITMEQPAAAQKAAIETSQRFSSEGKHVRYIRSTCVPEDAHCICLFEAADTQLVQEVNEAAVVADGSAVAGYGPARLEKYVRVDAAVHGRRGNPFLSGGARSGRFCSDSRRHRMIGRTVFGQRQERHRATREGVIRHEAVDGR